ncbi:MAG: AMP-binding protein [Cellulomonas sp.]|nr:AMP-binding protein [Cellulomonas sp.]
MVFRSPLPDVEIPDVPLYDFLLGSLRDDELDRIAIVDGPSGTATTYGALRAQVDALAGALAARGVTPGTVVGLHAPNVPAFAVAFHAILRAGATATTVNALATADDVAAQLVASGAALLLTVSPLLPAAVKGTEVAGLPHSRVIVLDGAPGHESLRDLLAEHHPAPQVTVRASDLAVLPYSSGTAGRAKGVMLTHRNLVANVLQASPYAGVRSEDTVLALLPFFHIYGMTVLLDLALHHRARLVTMPRFDLVEFCRIVAEHAVTYAPIAPPVAVALAKHPLIDSFDFSSLRTVLSGAAPLDEGVGNAVATRLGVRMLQGYGMTEMSPVSHLTPIDRPDVPVGSIGLTVPNLECMIVVPGTREEVVVPADGPSEPGELLCRGPNIMVGYLGDEVATAAALDPDGFLHTGDLATVDAGGVVRIADRLKELIKYKGYQVAPAELEGLLLSHPQIADAAVVGARDAEGQEEPKAFVVPVAGVELTAADVMDYVAAKVAPYKKVRQVEFVEAIPKSAAGKILRRELRARARG